MQTEYYATHQCFLSKRALYLVLWKLTDGLAGIERMEQWLVNIQVIIQCNLRATSYACFLPCLIRLFFEKFQRETRNSIKNFRKIIELDKAENRRIK